VPAARITFLARHRLRQPGPGQPAATCAAYPDPSWLDRGARQPAGTPPAGKWKDTVMTFVVVANLDDLEVGDTMLVDELREPICLIRLDDDDVRAIHNTCTHQQQPLHEGTLQDDDTLVCAAHASRYDLTTGEAVGVFACGPIPVYACRIEDDAILVDIDQQLNDAPIPNPPASGTLGAR
jgi:3-phenylpropionate/trans-cinnamate dioxygenase ferredoxin subunit